VIPLPYIAGAWALSLALTASGTWLYVKGGEAQAIKAAEAKMQTRLSEATRKAEQAAREAEQAHRAQIDAIAAQYETERAKADEVAARTVAALRAGSIRLRTEWQGCETAARVSEATSGPAIADALARLREQGASDLVRLGAECDARIRGLQSLIR
jgi:hypothetical protein